MKNSAHANATESQIEPRNRTLPPAAGASLRDRLLASGLRMTRQRAALLRILEEADLHMDAATLLERARQEVDIDRATVYRTLEALKKNGLIDELDLMHLRGEMHYFEARTRREHFHLACLCCGEIREMEHPLFDALKIAIEQTKGFTVTTARLEVGGTCAACQQKQAQSAAAPTPVQPSSRPTADKL